MIRVLEMTKRNKGDKRPLRKIYTIVPQALINMNGQ